MDKAVSVLTDIKIPVECLEQSNEAGGDGATHDFCGTGSDEPLNHDRQHKPTSQP